MNFISFDFETTGGKSQFPCALGIAVVVEDKIIQEGYFLINPEAKIEPYVTKNIHGISDDMVKNSPTFPEVWSKVSPIFDKIGVAVAHNVSFDKEMLKTSCLRYNIPFPKCFFECSYALCKEKHPALPKYSLDYLCSAFDIELKNHHNAQDDARSAAELTLKLFSNSYSPIACVPVVEKNNVSSPTKYEFKQPEIDYDIISDFCCENKRFVFTGCLNHLSRSKAVEVVKANGGKVSSKISKFTNFLVVGVENMELVNDKENGKSTKIIDAENLKSAGSNIKIIKGTDFEEYLQKHFNFEFDEVSL